jgi:hypothetical protein
LLYMQFKIGGGIPQLPTRLLHLLESRSHAPRERREE